MGTSITSETVLQNAICGEIVGSNKGHKFPKIAKKTLRVPNKDNEYTKDISFSNNTSIRKPNCLSKSSNKRKTEI